MAAAQRGHRGNEKSGSESFGRSQPDCAPKLAVLSCSPPFDLKRRRFDLFAQFFDSFAGSREREPVGRALD